MAVKIVMFDALYNGYFGERGVLPIMAYQGRVEKSVIWFSKRAKRCILCCEKVEETFWFCDFSSFKDIALTAVKRDERDKICQ